MLLTRGISWASLQLIIAELSVALIPKNERTRSTQLISREIKEKTLQIPGVKVRVNPIGIFGQADEAPIQMFVFGNERDSVDKAADMIKDILASIPGTDDIRKSSEEGKPETKVNIDREKIGSIRFISC